MKLSTKKLYKVKGKKVIENFVYIEAEEDLPKSKLKLLGKLALEDIKEEDCVISFSTKITPVYSDDLIEDLDDNESYAYSLDPKNPDQNTLQMEVDNNIDIPLIALHMMQPSRPNET